MILSKLSLASPQETADSLKTLKQELLTCFTTTWNTQSIQPPKHIIMTGSSVLYMLGLINREPTDIDVVILVEEGLRKETLLTIVKSAFEGRYKNIKFTSRPLFDTISITVEILDFIPASLSGSDIATCKENLTIDFLIQEINKDNPAPMLKLGGLLISPVHHIFATKKILNPAKYYRDLTDINKVVSEF